MSEDTAAEQPAPRKQREGGGREEDAGCGIARLAGDPPSPWEGSFGYSRTVSVGPWVLIGGTTSVDPHGSVQGSTPYEQAVVILRRLLNELERVGARATEVVQTRIYVTDISRAEEVGRAHAEAFGEAPPVATMVQVERLIDPRMLVEIELVAHRCG